MNFSFRRTVVHCCSGSVLAPDAAKILMLGRADRFEYVEAGMGTGVGQRA